MLTLTVNRGEKVATLTANGDLAVKKSLLLLDVFHLKNTWERIFFKK